MANNTANNQQSNNSSTNWDPAAIQQHGLPQPAGTNENGNPYWVINGRKVSWQEMQQYLWQQRQQTQRQASGGGGFEMPSMPMQQMETPGSPETREQISTPERNIEQGENRTEQAIETRQESPPAGKQAKKPQAKPNKTSTEPLVGHSAKVPFKSDDPYEMRSFYDKNRSTKQNHQKSLPYLSTFVGKVLRQLFVN